jgi:hypothetical protein
VSDFSSTPEWKMGDGVQREWALKVAGSGRVVLPTYTMNDDQAENKAPLLLTSSGTLTAPDLLVTAINENTRWHEVKAKSKPSWRRCKPGPRWEHGCDWCLAMEYKEVQTQAVFAVYIIVHEARSPSNVSQDSPLTGPETWLAITLDDALKKGEKRKDWPGGKFNPKRRGKKGMGGLLWNRADMSVVSL